MNAHTLLLSSETLLEGKWLPSGGTVVADATSQRIEFLILHALVQLATDDSGWVVLYRDPQDSRTWELSYPDSEEHGGGAPVLRCIDASEVARKYANIKW